MCYLYLKQSSSPSFKTLWANIRRMFNEYCFDRAVECRESHERGVIPRFSQRMWDLIDSKPEVEYKVEISYFEIYAERIFDLLVPPSKGQKSKNHLKVREHPVMGPYVENLKVYPALNYNDIEGYMTLGGKYRATASTNMNATSSRSHAVFTIHITQTLEEEGEEHTKVCPLVFYVCNVTALYANTNPPHSILLFCACDRCSAGDDGFWGWTQS